MNDFTSRKIEECAQLEGALFVALELLGMLLDECPLERVRNACYLPSRARQLVAACWSRVHHLDWVIARTPTGAASGDLSSLYQRERDALVCMAERIWAPFGNVS